MNALVVYDSQYGNTERIAKTIAETLRSFGPAQAVRVDPALSLEGIDMLVLGSPTQGWRPTPAMRSLVERVASGRPRGLAVASFDTRFRKPRWLTGSAARSMAKTLGKAGTSLIVPAESFFVKGTEGPLDDGELERAAEWARALVEHAAALHRAA